MSKRELVPDLEYQRAFGDNLRKLREGVGWTQGDLAIHSKVSDYQISTIENGREGPNLQTILALALALGKRPAQLFRFNYSLKLNTDFPKKKERRPGTTGLVKRLLGTKFFNQPRSVKQVVDQCKKESNVTLRSAETSGALLLLTNKKILRIIKSEGKNLYQAR